MSLQPGSHFGRYEIVGLLGAGGMGVVYRARDPRLAREVALKTLPERFARSPEFRTRFEREGRLLAALTHPHIAAILGLEEHDGDAALVLELVDGPMLSEWVAVEQRPLAELLRVAGEIASGLEAAHARGIVHRDLKPANVRIARDGAAKILDFGIAHEGMGGSLAETSAALTAAGAVLGTPGYLSPEQAAGAVADARADVWAFGALLFEMIARRPAFLRPTAQETLAAVVTGQVPWEVFPKGVDTRVRGLLEECLATDAGGRPVNAGILRERIAACRAAPRPETETPSLLVLPFESLGADPENEAFADGLTEEVIADLARVSELRVFSRATALRYRGERRDAAFAARELGSRYVLEGSVRRAGPNVRVTVQLVEVAQDAPIWADKYSGTLEDVFAIQETISRAIAAALRLQFGATGDKRFAGRRSGSPAAYDVYLRTRSDIDSFSLPRIERARTLLERALEELGPDPYLYRGLGRVAWQYINAGISRDPEHFERLDDCIRRLDEMDPGGPHGITLRALRAMVSGDIGAWYRALERSVAADPGDTEMQIWKALVLSWVGRTDEGRAVASQLGVVDPFNEYLGFSHALAAVLEGRFEDARRVAERNLADHPGSAGWPTMLAQIQAMAGDRAGALRTVRSYAVEPQSGGLLALSQVMAAALQGERGTVERLVTLEFRDLMWNDFQYAHMMAQSYCLLGDRDEALCWLTRAVERGFVHHRFFAEVDPLLAPLREDGRFRALMETARRRAEEFPEAAVGAQ